MIYFLHGTNTKQAREKAHQLYESLLKKKPDASFFRIDAENWVDSDFEEKIESQGLFENKFIVFLDQVFQNVEAKESVLAKIKELSVSANIFILLEEKVDKKSLEKIEKVAEKTQEFELSEKSPRKFGMGEEHRPLSFDDFNIFSLTDALGRRDKKSLWILFSKAKTLHIPAEEIHGVLFWQLKAMLVAGESATAEASGLKPFVYSKAKTFAKNFSSDELKKLSSSMVTLYHDARRGVHDMDTALERFVLGL